MLSHIEYDSNHGTSQGIWPRFYLQIVDLGDLALGKSEVEKRTDIYLEKVIPELTNLYDIYHKLINIIESYKTGVQKGKYFSVDERGRSTFDRLCEIDIANSTTNFIIRCKIALVNLIKCEFIIENEFKIADFFFCDTAKLQTRKATYLKTTTGKFLPLIQLIENGNKLLLALRTLIIF